MEKKQKGKNKNFKLLSKKAFMGLAVASLMIASPVMLTGCGKKGDPGKDGAPGAPGKNGSAWYTGTQYDLSQGVVGDFFYDTDDGKIYRKNEGGWYLISTIKSSVSINSAGYWVIDGIQTNVKAKGEDGTNGTNGTNGENGTDGLTPEIKNGYWWIGETNTEIPATGENGKSAFELSGFDGTVEEWIASLKGEKGDTGAEGPQGEKGDDGISAYVGYDGHIWHGSERTDFTVNATLPENVVENTIGIQGVMSKYFEGSYVDLSTNTIALMANYMPTIKATQYSGTEISQIKVYAENEGFVHIGTAKVEDVVNARLTGDAYEFNTSAYLVEKGLNTINLELVVAQDETIVLGGNGSVGLFVSKGIAIDDEDGNFTLLDNKTNEKVVAETDEFKDTLAIQVTAIAKQAYQVAQCLPGIDNVVNSYDLTKFADYVHKSAPFRYQENDNKNSYFAGKTIDSIGVPVNKLTDYTKDQVLTIFVIEKTKLNSFASNYVSKHELVIPANTFNSNNVYDWYYFDLSDKNIVVGETQTLAFFSSTDTVFPGYNSVTSDAGHNNKYDFIDNSGNKCGEQEIYWDVKYRVEGDIEESEPEVIEPGYVKLLKNVVDDLKLNDSRLTAYKTETAPYTYSNKTYFAGHKLAKIGVPVYEVVDYTKDSKFTIYIVKQSKVPGGSYNTEGNYVSKHELIVPANTFSSNTVKQWYYFDVESLNITVGADETIAFFDPTDTLFPAYIQGGGDIPYKFHTNSANSTVGSSTIYYDIQYYDEGGVVESPETDVGNGFIIKDFAEHLNDLKEKEAIAKAQADELAKISALKEVLSGKNFSILGDSISTYTGYSNDSANTNSTIGSNAVWYNSQIAVTDTWWRQIATETGMNVLVNNSYSGDTVASAKTSRCKNLHDNTGDNAGTMPDVIAVYMGVNDIKNSASLSVSTFKTNYLTLVKNMKVAYANSDIFLFTIPQYNYASTRTDAELNVYNEAIREIAAAEGCVIVDLFADSGVTKTNLSEYTIDNLHPNSIGMDLITKCFWNALYETYVTNAKENTK